MLEPNLVTTSPSPIGIALPSLAAVKVTGSDAEAFLQGQLTCDLNQLTLGLWQLAGHCDAKGKLWSISRIARTEDGFLLLQNQSTLEKSLAQLKKFSVFSKVEFTDISDSYTAYAIIGTSAQQAVEKLLAVTLQLPFQQVGDYSAFTLVKGAYLVMVPNGTELQMPLHDERYWQALQIEQGWPNLSAEQQEEFIPQMLNLDTLGAISFKKGCYIGQETVARMHYKGMNKRRLATLTGYAKSTPAPTTLLEVKLGGNWRRAGAVISAVRYDSDVVAIQAVLPSDLEATAQLRIKGQEDSKFTPCQKSDETESINE